MLPENEKWLNRDRGKEENNMEKIEQLKEKMEKTSFKRATINSKAGKIKVERFSKNTFKATLYEGDILEPYWFLGESNKVLKFVKVCLED